MKAPYRMFAGWLFLAFVTGFVAFLNVYAVVSVQRKASKSSVAKIEKQVNPSRDQAVKVACTYVASQASSQGLIVSKCGISAAKSAYKTKGDAAIVTLDVESASAGAKWQIVVSLNKGAWQAQGLQVTAQKKL